MDNLTFNLKRCDDAWQLLVDENGWVLEEIKLKMSPEELKDFLKRAVKSERRTYGYTFWGVFNGENIQIFVRFLNETTSAKETVVDYINRAYIVEQLFLFDYEAYCWIFG